MSLDLLCALRKESLLAQLLRTRSGDVSLKSTGRVGRQPQMTAMAHSSWVQYMVGAMKTAERGIGQCHCCPEVAFQPDRDTNIRHLQVLSGSVPSNLPTCTKKPIRDALIPMVNAPSRKTRLSAIFLRIGICSFLSTRLANPLQDLTAVPAWVDSGGDRGVESTEGLVSHTTRAVAE